MKNNPAGWYRNAADRRQHGYWDGLAWVDPSVAEPSEPDPDLDPDEDSD